MSFSIHLHGHVSPEDPAKDALVRKLAHAFSSILHSVGIDHTAQVGTPTGGGEIAAPTGPLVVADGKLCTSGVTADSTPTNHQPH